MKAAHSKIGASSMHRWAACPGSVALSKDMPNTSSKYAEEGTQAHELAADYIKMELRGNDGGDIADFQDKWPEIDSEMNEAVQVYVQAFLAEVKDVKNTFVEERFDLSSLYPGLYGTADGVIYHSETKVLQVWDYKHGAGLAVEVEYNDQLMYYGLGALMKTKLPCKTVELVICQPRCFHPHGPIRKWKIEAIDLLDFAADLIAAAKKTEDPNAIFVSGDHCRFCPAAPICPLLHSTALDNAKSEFSPVLPYDPEHLSRTLALLPAIEAWAKSVKEFAFAEAERGRIVPGYKLVPKRASRKWKLDEEDIETALLHGFGLSYADVTKKALKSPAQIEALLTKEQKKELENLVTKESSGNTLAPVSDKRTSSLPSVETDFTVIND